jgi:putative ABC transport system permease protein
MNPFEYFRVAIGSVAHNKVRSLLTMLGVIIGVMSVILLVALGEAAQIFVESEFAGMGTNILMITPGKQETTGMMPIFAGSFRKLKYQEAKQVERRGKGIKAVSPVVLGAGRVSWADRRRDTMIIGGTPAFLDVRNLAIGQGRFINLQDIQKRRNVCVLGTKVKEELFGAENALGKQVSINRRKHIVVGVMEPKGMMLGLNMDDLTIIPIVSGQQMFHGGEDILHQILVQARSPDEVELAMEEARRILKEEHDYIEDFTITDQKAMMDTFGKIFLALKVMLGGIASISLLVGGIGIMNIMLVSVRERTREVGIRKAVGATRADVGFQFAIESITISAIGGLIGIAVAYLSAFGVRVAFPAFPVYCAGWAVATAFLFSLSVGVFFGAYPAYKAASVDPVDALRYE